METIVYQFFLLLLCFFLLYLLSLCLINNKILQIQVSRQRDFSFVLFHCWLGNFAQNSILLLCTNTILPLFIFSTLLFVSFGLMVGFRLLFFALFCSICVCVSVVAPVILQQRGNFFLKKFTSSGMFFFSFSVWCLGFLRQHFIFILERETPMLLYLKFLFSVKR